MILTEMQDSGISTRLGINGFGASRTSGLCIMETGLYDYDVGLSVPCSRSCKGPTLTNIL